MQVNGVDLNVQITGSGTSFIWGHGLTSSMSAEDALGWFAWEQWDQIAKHVQLIRYDARGHGRSQASYNATDYRWPNLAQDMIALASQVTSGTMIAGGQSMGCATSLYMALAVPSQVKGLVLVNPPTAWQTRLAQAGNYLQMARMIEARGLSALASMAAMQPADPDNWVAEMMPAPDPAQFTGIDAKALIEVFKGAAQSDLPDPTQFDSLNIPVLILAWTGDPGHPVSTAETLAAHLSNHRLVIARNAQDMKSWPQLIREFVADLA